MGKIIYGVDTDSFFSTLNVRDAIIECFWEAHCLDTGLGNEKSNATKSYCKSIIEKIYTDNEWDFNNPTKEMLLGTLKELAEFSKNFRDPSIIQGHFNELSELVNKLP